MFAPDASAADAAARGPPADTARSEAPPDAAAATQPATCCVPTVDLDEFAHAAPRVLSLLRTAVPKKTFKSSAADSLALLSANLLLDLLVKFAATHLTAQSPDAFGDSSVSQSVSAAAFEQFLAEQREHPIASLAALCRALPPSE